MPPVQIKYVVWPSSLLNMTFRNTGGLNYITKIAWKCLNFQAHFQFENNQYTPCNAMKWETSFLWKLLLKHGGEENSMEHLAPKGWMLIQANKLNKGLKSSLLVLHHICYNSLRTEVVHVALSSMICLWKSCVLDWGNMHLCSQKDLIPVHLETNWYMES